MSQSSEQLKSINLTEATLVSRVLRQIFWTLCIYFVMRLLFLTWNYQVWYSQISIELWGPALLEGLRFDLSIVATLSSLVLVFSLIPWYGISLRIKSLTLTTALLLIHTPLLLPNLIDTEFIHFIGRRFTSDSFFLAGETQGKLLTLLFSYWPLTLISFFIIAVFVMGMLELGKTKSNDFFNTRTKRILISIVIFLTAVLAGRGGLQLKPLELAHAMGGNDSRLSHLVLNSSFTLAHAMDSVKLKLKNDFASEELMTINLNQNLPGDVAVFPQRPKNVVLIILESFSQEYLGFANKQGGQSLTPFLDSLSERSIVFNNAFANGRRSIEALPSILSGLPALMREPFLTSKYQDIQIPEIPKALNEKQIQTAFFHGGQNGTMFFDQFTQRIGFQKYFGAKEYPHSGDNDGTWGIWDEPFLQYMIEEVDKMQGPFFVTFFSLSSHHPFKVPEKYENKFKGGALEIHKTIEYTDYALMKFFDRAANSPWFEDTLFIITADHTSKSARPEYQNFLGAYRVPLMMFWPAQLWPEKIPTDQAVQQADIIETVKDVFEVSAPSFKFSRSLFKSGPRNVFLSNENTEALIQWPYLLMSQESGESLYDLSQDFQLKSPLEILTAPTNVGEMRERIKANRQYFNNSLIRNRF